MTCYLCTEPIQPHAEINWHHYDHLKSEGGTEVAPTHKDCHVRFHSANGQYAEWGRRGGQQSAITKRWSLNLLNVKTHPAHDINRSFYRAHYAH